jgi:hypothetical protein
MGGVFRGSLITKITQQQKKSKKIKQMVSKAFEFTQ